MTCEQAEEALAALLTGNQPDETEVAALRAHLSDCGGCQEAADGFGETTTRMAVGLAPVEPPAHMRARLVAAVSADSEFVSAGAAAAPPRLAVPIRGRWIRRSAVMGVFAGIAAGIGIGVMVARPAAVSPAGAPPMTIAMRGTTADPRSGGQLVYDPTAHRTVLEVTGLPALGSSGEVYQLWLVHSDKTVAAAGYLTPAPNGTMWLGVIDGDMATATAVAATRETGAGLSKPGGAEVVHADLQLP